MRVLLFVAIMAAAAVATCFAWTRIGIIGRDPHAHQIERGLISLVLGLGSVNAAFWLIRDVVGK